MAAVQSPDNNYQSSLYDCSGIPISGSAQAHLGHHYGNNHYYQYPAPPIRHESLPVPSSNVPFSRDRDFVDRGSVLTEIEQKCTEGAARVALVGLGGVGKSQLAIEYCHRLRQRSRNTWIFWIYAGSTNRIEQGFREIAEDFKIPGREDPKADIFGLVKRWLRNERKGHWLLVLDNVDDDAVLTLPQSDCATGLTGRQSSSRYLLDYIPQVSHGTLLITTRTMNVANKLVEPRGVIPIKPMTMAHATELFKKKITHPVEDNEIQQLVATLEFMPLAIVQAAAFIEMRAPRCSVQAYIDMFNRSDKEKSGLLNHEAGCLRRDSEAKNSILIAWQISFDHIQQKWPSAANLLSLMSFFDRQGIPESVLKAQIPDQLGGIGEKCCADYDTATIDDQAFDFNLDRLRDYCFVSVDDNGHIFSMHRLVQLSMQEWLIQHQQQEQYKTLFLHKLATRFPAAGNQDWKTCGALFPHIKAAEVHLLDYRSYDRSMRAWELLLYRAAAYTRSRGFYEDADRLCRESLEILQRRSVPDPENESRIKRMLADTMWLRARYSDAEALLIEIIKANKEVLGAMHAQTILGIASLATVHRHQGRWGEAETLAAQALAMSKSVYGETDLFTVCRMVPLAAIYQGQGRWTESEGLESLALRLLRVKLGEDHPRTLPVMGNLAATLSHQQRFAEAEELEIQVLAKNSELYGKEHRTTLVAMNNLGATYRDRNRLIEAEKLLKDAKKIGSNVAGADHPVVLLAMTNLGSVYCLQGRLTEAYDTHSEALARKTKVLGAMHSDTLRSVYELAITLKKLHREDEAVSQMTTCYEARMKVLGPIHPHTVLAGNKLKEWQESATQKLQENTDASQIELNANAGPG